MGSAGAVHAIRDARSWPVFRPDRRANFWINMLLIVVALAASYGAALGQAGFAEIYLGMHGPERYVVFLIIEATAVALMLLANQTALAGDSATGLWALVWAVTAGAVAMQILHARAIGHPEAAMVYATASVLTVALWRAKTRRSLRDRLRAAGMIEDPLPRYRPIRWLLRPRETFRAWYLALGEGVSDPATAMDMARADRLYHRSAQAARAAERRARRRKLPAPDLTDSSHVVPPWRVTHPDAHRFGVLPWHHHTPVQMPVPTAPAPAVHAVGEGGATTPIGSTPTPRPPDDAGTGSAETGNPDTGPRTGARTIDQAGGERRDRGRATDPVSVPAGSPGTAAPGGSGVTPDQQVTESGTGSERNGAAAVPVVQPPSPLPPTLRAELEEHLGPERMPGGILKNQVFNALDARVEDPEADEALRTGAIAAQLAGQLNADAAIVTRLVRQWQSEVAAGRREHHRASHRRPVRRSASGRRLTDTV